MKLRGAFGVKERRWWSVVKKGAAAVREGSVRQTRGAGAYVALGASCFAPASLSHNTNTNSLLAWHCCLVVCNDSGLQTC